MTPEEQRRFDEQILENFDPVTMEFRSLQKWRGFLLQPGKWRSYKYVGREDILENMGEPPRTLISKPSEIVGWLEPRRGEVDREGNIGATFIIDTNGWFWVADRRSEHVACARGGEVLAAGEVFFASEKGSIRVERITNQSTGYCPEVSSWAVVDEVLQRVSILHPDRFEPEFEFRRCPKCRNIALVKDGDYSCMLCGEVLPETWNIDEP